MVPPIIKVEGIKEVLDVYAWRRRVQADPKKLYGFLLCTDEHEAFLRYLQKAWSTLNTLSGNACDLFTLEHQRKGLATYLPLSTTAPPVTGDLGSRDTSDGIVLPDRTQCLALRDALFAKPESVILPGLAVFASINERTAVYYPCNGLTSDEISATFQKLFNSM